MAAVTLLAPAHLSTGISINPILGWVPVPVREPSYQLQISTDAFTTVVKDISGITNSQYGVSGLAYNTGYYWRVRCYDAFGNPGAWSDEWTFATVASLSSVLIRDVANVPIFTSSSRVVQVGLKYNTSLPSAAPVAAPGPPAPAGIPEISDHYFRMRAKMTGTFVP